MYAPQPLMIAVVGCCCSISKLRRKIEFEMKLHFRQFCPLFYCICFCCFVKQTKSDEFIDRIEFCKEHLSPFVDEQQHYESLLSEQGHKFSTSAKRETYRNLDECFKAKYFDEIFIGEDDILEVYETDAYNFDTVLERASRNVTKLVIKLDTISQQDSETAFKYSNINLNISSVLGFLKLDEFWLVRINVQSTRRVDLSLFQTKGSTNFTLNKLHVQVPVEKFHIDYAISSQISLLDIYWTTDTYSSYDAYACGWLPKFDSLTVLAAKGSYKRK